MCGIYGFAGIENLDKNFLNLGIQKLRHRGPDDEGIFSYENMGIAMCRLAINEIETGSQPYISTEDSISVVFNGEIYNYLELTQKYELPRNTSEAHLIAYLFSRHGEEFVNLLDGMFAIAILNYQSKELLLYRDYFGKKPMWYQILPKNGIEFASEIKALQGTKTFRNEFFSEYMMFGYVPNSRSAFNEVKSLPPGSYLKWKNGNTVVQKFWQLPNSPVDKIGYDEAKENVRFLLENAVKKRLISERPIGVFLSGGYDSTLVSAVLAQQANHEVKAFSIGFKDLAFNEAEYSKKVANHLGLKHRVEILDFDIASTISHVFSRIDLPFADSSIIPTYLLNKFASEEIVVALGGDGGDEIFGGYDRYLWTPLLQKYNFLSNFVPNSLPNINSKIPNINRKLARFSQESTTCKTIAQRYSRLMSLIKPENLSTLIKSEIVDISSFQYYQENFEISGLSSLKQMMLSDINNYLPGDLLVKADLASMFNSVELRSPLLDKYLASYAFNLPDKYLVNGLQTKRLIKDLTHDYVPKSIMQRPKMGFGVPMDDWLRFELNEMLHELVLNSSSNFSSYLNVNQIKSVVAKQEKGENHSRTLWPILALMLWERNIK